VADGGDQLIRPLPGDAEGYKARSGVAGQTLTGAVRGIFGERQRAGAARLAVSAQPAESGDKPLLAINCAGSRKAPPDGERADRPQSAATFTGATQADRASIESATAPRFSSTEVGEMCRRLTRPKGVAG